MNITFAAKIYLMKKYRPLLDIFMGIFYLAMAAFVIYYRRFGTMELSSGLVYGMGGLLILYGLFRLYLGITRHNA